MGEEEAQEERFIDVMMKTVKKKKMGVVIGTHRVNDQHDWE